MEAESHPGTPRPLSCSQDGVREREAAFGAPFSSYFTLVGEAALKLLLWFSFVLLLLWPLWRGSLT